MWVKKMKLIIPLDDEFALSLEGLFHQKHTDTKKNRVYKHNHYPVYKQICTETFYTVF